MKSNVFIHLSFLTILMFAGFLPMTAGNHIKVRLKPQKELLLNKSPRSIEVMSCVNLFIKEGRENKILIEASEKQLKNMRIGWNGDEFVLDGNTSENKGFFEKFTNGGSIKVTFYLQDLSLLDELTASGASSILISDPLKTNESFRLDISGASSFKAGRVEVSGFSLDLSGASSVSIALVADKSSLDISGASKLEIEGKSTSMNLDISGASKCSAKRFRVKNASVDVSGVSQATLCVSDYIKGDVSGVSKLQNSVRSKRSSVSASGLSSFRY